MSQSSALLPTSKMALLENMSLNLVKTLTAQTGQIEGDSLSADIILGAYLIQHLRSHCENCGAVNTVQWRKGWHSEVLNHSVLLCNACGLKWLKKQYCPFCNAIYGSKRQGDRISVAKKWLVCCDCRRKAHHSCAMNNGINLRANKYRCPDCVKQRQQQALLMQQQMVQQQIILQQQQIQQHQTPLMTPNMFSTHDLPSNNVPVAGQSPVSSPPHSQPSSPTSSPSSSDDVMMMDLSGAPQTLSSAHSLLSPQAQ